MLATSYGSHLLFRRCAGCYLHRARVSRIISTRIWPNKRGGTPKNKPPPSNNWMCIFCTPIKPVLQFSQSIRFFLNEFKTNNKNTQRFCVLPSLFHKRDLVHKIHQQQKQDQEIRAHSKRKSSVLDLVRDRIVATQCAMCNVHCVQ